MYVVVRKSLFSTYHYVFKSHESSHSITFHCKNMSSSVPSSLCKDLGNLIPPLWALFYLRQGAYIHEFLQGRGITNWCRVHISLNSSRIYIYIFYIYTYIYIILYNWSIYIIVNSVVASTWFFRFSQFSRWKILFSLIFFCLKSATL